MCQAVQDMQTAETRNATGFCLAAQRCNLRLEVTYPGGKGCGPAAFPDTIDVLASCELVTMAIAAFGPAGQSPDRLAELAQTSSTVPEGQVLGGIQECPGFVCVFALQVCRLRNGGQGCNHCTLHALQVTRDVGQRLPSPGSELVRCLLEGKLPIRGVRVRNTEALLEEFPVGRARQPLAHDLGLRLPRLPHGQAVQHVLECVVQEVLRAGHSQGEREHERLF